MTWNDIGTWVVATPELLIPVSFTSRLVIKATNVANLRSTWNWAGFLYQYLELDTLGQVLIDKKINVPTKESVLFIPEIYQPNYTLKFIKATWIPSLTLTIFEDSMPITTTQESVIFPNTVASSSTGTTVPITATSTVLLVANTNRKKYMIENNSNQDLYIDFAATASVANHAQKVSKISPGGAISTWFDDDYTGVISGIWAAAGTGAALIREFV